MRVLVWRDVQNPVAGGAEVSAGEPDGSRKNHTVVDEWGGTAYVPFEEDASGQTGA